MDSINMFLLAFIFLLKVKLNKAPRFSLNNTYGKCHWFNQNFVRVFSFSWCASKRNHFKAYFRCLFSIEEITPTRCIIRLLQQGKFHPLAKSVRNKNTHSLQKVCYLNWRLRIFFSVFFASMLFHIKRGLQAVFACRQDILIYVFTKKYRTIFMYSSVKCNSWCWASDN